MRVSSETGPSSTLTSHLLSVQILLLPALVVYGFLVNPLTAQGGLPCIWRLCFGLECPGCGLSRADALFVRGWFREAVAHNWLIIPVWLVATKSFVTQVARVLERGGPSHG